MKLEDVVPWGRTLKEYELMFNILEEDKEKRILGCGDGPASFNAELTQS
ncbi:SAM-dependent methyltransferase, partial [Vibrio parahaemolyticus]